MLKSSFDFIFDQFWQDIYQRSMFFFNHFINRYIINQNQLNSYSVSIQQLFCYNFIFEIFVHYDRFETFKTTYNVLLQNFRNSFRFKLNKTQIFIYSVKSFFITTSVFINFDWNRWTQSIFIFWNKFEIWKRWNAFSFRLKARS